MKNQGDVSRRAVLAGIGSTALLTGLSGRAEAAGNVFRIGAPNTITGAAGVFGTGVQNTIIEMAKRLNAAGGAGGHTFEVFAEDTQTLPEPALLAARKLIEVNEVKALLGVYSSPEALAIIPVSNAADVVLMHTGAAPKLAADNTEGLGFQFYPSSQSIGFVLNQIVTKEGYERPVTLTLTNDASIGNSTSFHKYWAEQTGSEPEDIRYQPNQPNYRSELQQALLANPDVIILNGYEPDATIIMKQLYELGNTARVIAPEFAVTTRLIEALGPELVEDTIVYRFVPNSDSAAYTLFDEVYQAAMDAPGSANTYAAIAYDEMNLVALALELDPAISTGAELANAIHKVCGPDGEPCNSFAEGKELIAGGATVLNYLGASGPCDFDDQGRTPGNFGVSEVKSGEYVFAYGIVFED